MHRSSHFRLRWFAFVLLLAVPAAVRAQRLTGSVADAMSREPIPLALVALVDTAGTVLQQVLTNESGRFVLTPAGSGRVRLRIERIGYASAYEPFFDLAAGTERDFRILIDVQPITLEGIAVSEERYCSINSSASETLRVWTEARKALAASVVAERQRVLRFSGVRFRRRTTERGAVTELWTRPFMSSSRQPFVSRPAADLMEHGYVRTDETGINFFAPNAEVLLSPEFEQMNCFSLTRNRAEPGLIGVRFAPNRRHDVSAIEGTVWLDSRTARLRFVEFDYVNTARLRYAQLASGRVEFQMLPNGGWLVSRWYIRMPSSVREEGPRTRAISFIEDGGEVRTAFSGTSKWDILSAGTITGLAVDSTTGLPLHDAGISLSGTALSARTDKEGRFQISNLPAGSYRLTLSHARLDSVPPFATESVAVTVSSSSTARVLLAIPPLERTAIARCLTQPQASADRVAVYGTMRDATTREPIGRARLRLSWDSVFTTNRQFVSVAHGLELETDADGRFIACDLPARMTIRAELLGNDGATTSMQFHTGTPTARVNDRDILHQPLSVRRDDMQSRVARTPQLLR